MILRSRAKINRNNFSNDKQIRLINQKRQTTLILTNNNTTLATNNKYIHELRHQVVSKITSRQTIKRKTQARNKHLINKKSLYK